MNEHLRAGPECFRIIKEHERGPPSVRLTPDGAALDAYLCPSGQWTLGFGCSFWEDGTPVEQGDTLDPSHVETMLAANVRSAELYIYKHVTRELNQYQFDALVSFRFNTRESTLRTSTKLLPNVNLGRWHDAADAFTEFVYGSGSYNGKPYQDALRGLLRRRLHEALVFLGYDWAEAVKDNDVALPTERRYIESRGIYRDYIREGKTTLAHVLPTAQRYPLPPLVDPELFDTEAPLLLEAARGAGPVAEPPNPQQPVPLPIVAKPKEPATSKAEGGAGASGPVALAPSVPAPSVATPGIVAPVGTKAPSPFTVAPNAVPYKIDAEAGLKPLETSDRAKGFYWQTLGTATLRFASLGAFGTTAATASQAVEQDPVLMQTLMIFIPVAGVAAGGFIMKAWGDYKRQKGEQEATQALF